LTLEDIYGVAIEVCNCDPAELQAGTRIADLVIDSIALVELAIELQLRFGVEFDHDDLDHIETAEDLVRLINDKR
jgi:acyl carrier protein